MSTPVALRRMPVATARALADGTLARPADWHPQMPAEGTVSAARMLLGTYEALGVEVDDALPWWFFGIVVAGVVVGDAGFHGPPADEGPAEVEIGYQVVPELRRRGVATRTCGLLLAHAWRHGAVRVRAEVDPGPYADASRAVLRVNGFRLLEAGDLVVEAPVGPRV